MFKSVVMIAALLALAASALAGPAFTLLADQSGSPATADGGTNFSFIRDYQYVLIDPEDGQGYLFTTDALRVDVFLADPGELAGKSVSLIGMGMALTGSGAAHLLPLPEAMQKSATAQDLGGDLGLVNGWAEEFAGTGHPWQFTAGQSSASNLGGVGGKTNFTWFAGGSDAKVLAAGDAVACFYFAWDGLGQGTSVVAQLFGDGASDQPYLQRSTGTPAGPQYGDATNSGLLIPLPVPEPATLSLLGLGLLGLLRRRR